MFAISLPSAKITQETIIGIITAGYVRTDFIEGFMTNKKRLSLGVTILLSIFVIVSCVPYVTLIAPYDEYTMGEVIELHKKTSQFFNELARSGGSSVEDYKNHVKFYDECKTRLDVLITRASTIPKNDHMVKELNILFNKYNEMEKQHRNFGLRKETIDPLKKSFDQLFRSIYALELSKTKGK